MKEILHNPIFTKLSKRILFAIIIVVASGSIIHAQFDKFIISFTNKNNSPYSLSNPSAYLSAKSIARRVKYNIALDSTDLPVNPDYVQQVLSKGQVTFLVQSKWLNDILVYTTDSAALTAINALPFVKKTEGVSIFKVGVRRPLINKSETVTTLVPPSATTNSVHVLNGINGVQGADSLQYGSNAAQVHIHHGEFLHNKGYTGSGITIAMLDAGFFHYTTLQAFDSLMANNQVLGVKDFVAYDNSVVEDDPHGMECLSTIAANIPGTMVGTAPKANFWLLRSEDVSSEYPIEEHNWVAAAEYADSAGADMISSSLGYNQFDNPIFNHTYANFYNNSTMVTQGAAMAAKKGFIVTNSAGNEGNNSWKYIIFPADADSVCTVGAVDVNGVIGSFSSFGYSGRQKPNIVSVGVNATVFGVGGSPVMGSGTSFSNPNINGLIACLWQAFPQYNNMTILNAVYQSSDRYNNPDNQYGYGIPNMQTAYLILKKMQNDSLYGSNWLMAVPNPFSDSLHVTFVAQVDGPVELSLKDAGGNLIATINITAENQEVYDTVFNNLGSYPGGNYTLTYTDSATVKTIPLVKTGALLTDWIQAVPIPFNQQLTVYIKAPESGSAYLRLVDANGQIVTSQQINVQQGSTYTVTFTNVAALAKGVYFIQYQGPQQKRTVKVLK